MKIPDVKKILITFCVFIIHHSLWSQSKNLNLVFEGAGIRGIAYAGALKHLEEKNILIHVERVGGTSAGAITALLVALGYTSDEMAEIVYSTSFRKFNDGRFFFPGGLSRVVKYFGWYRGEKFTKWLEHIIEIKTKDRNITFNQLENQGYKKLYVTGTNLTTQQNMIFSHENFANMRVADAIRISMSIPLYFEPVFMDKEGNIIRRPRKKEELNVMADGGLTANFPIWLFDSTKYAGATVNEIFSNPNTIGFRIDRTEQITYDLTEKKLAPMPIKNVKDYLSAFYNIGIENLNRQTLTAEDWQRTISISDGNISPRIRKLNRSELDTLTNNGSNATAKFIASRFN